MHRVAILGGGISGLVCAYRLLRRGAAVTLFEASEQLGGLGGVFEHEGHSLERFYHVMLNSDEHLLGLLKDLGLNGQAIWAESKMGFLHGQTLYPFNTPADLLRFGGLTWSGRVRTALGGAYIAKLCNDPRNLDSISVSEWLLSLFGDEVFQNLWRPLLRAKFGEMYESVPAYWFWSRLRREKGGSKEVKGYLPGGYRRIADRLRDEIERLGGAIRMNTPVQTVQSEPQAMRLTIGGTLESYDAAISTLPLPQLHALARGPLESAVPHKNLPYQGMVNAVAILRRRLQPYYWNAIVKDGYPFQGLVETTHVVPASQTGGRHLIYLLNYCPAGSPTYTAPDDGIEAQALQCLSDFNPGFHPSWVERVRVFRAPYVEPVWPLGYTKTKPKVRVDDSRLYLATTAQCYPQVNSWNTMTGIANDVAGRVHFDLENTYSGAKDILASVR